MDNPSINHVLYYNDYSICSVMVRFTLAVVKNQSSAGEPIVIDEKPIDIYRGEQLAEHFLTNINALGTVPILTSPRGARAPICESLDITDFLGSLFPSLYPTWLGNSIRTLLQELHSITYFSLSFNKTPQRATQMENSIKTLLSDSRISGTYRLALEYKLNHVLRTRAPMLTDEVVANEEAKALSFLSKIEAILATHQRDNSTWIFGTEAATALDAHVVPFVCRLIDVNRQDMLPARVQLYATRIFGLPVWKDFMNNKRTMAEPYLMN